MHIGIIYISHCRMARRHFDCTAMLCTVRFRLNITADSTRHAYRYIRDFKLERRILLAKANVEMPRKNLARTRLCFGSVSLMHIYIYGRRIFASQNIYKCSRI